MINTDSTAYRSPRWPELLGESLAFGELANLVQRLPAWAKRIPKGQSQTVLLIPGFMAGDLSLLPFARALEAAGHKTILSGIWCNADCPKLTIERLLRVLIGAREAAGRPIAIVGHSLGGLLAKELARQRPQDVSHIFLLASPVKDPLAHTTPTVRALALSAQAISKSRPGCAEGSCVACGSLRGQPPPSVAQTLVYSRRDGVVAWQSCIDYGPHIENIEVSTTHCGMPYSLDVIEIVLRRLAVASEPTEATESLRGH